MTMVTIKIPITVHKPSASFDPQLRKNRDGIACDFPEDIEVIRPNTWFEVDENEAIGLIKRFGGERKEPSK